MPDMRIQLTRGYYAIVDAEDHDLLSQHKWSTLRSGSGPLYAARKITQDGKRKAVLMHRVIARAPQGAKVDHINGNSLDNRKANLRIATDQQNQRGYKTPRKGKTSKFRGVHLRKKSGRWIAQISVDKKVIHIGCFETEEEAALAYNAHAKQHFGEFAHLNVLNRGGHGVTSPLDRLAA